MYDQKEEIEENKSCQSSHFLFYFERFLTSTKDLLFSSSTTFFLYDSSSERDKSFKNSKLKNIELINFTITTTITTFTILIITISISSINHSEKSQITEAQFVIRSTKSTKNVSFDWQLNSLISEKKRQFVIRSTESARNVNFDWQLNLISQMKEKNQKTLRNFSD